MKSKNFELSAGGPSAAREEQENNPVETREDLESREEMGGVGEKKELTAEDYLDKVNQAQEELRSAQEGVGRVESQKSKLAGIRERLGVSSEVDETQMQDYATAQESLKNAKDNFRVTFGNWGKSLAQERFGQDGQQPSSEDVLAMLYGEKMINTGEVDESGAQISRTLAEEYEARLRSTQEVSQEQPAAYKQIASKLFEQYNKIPRKAKVAVGTMCAAGIAAATGGVGAAVMAGGKSIAKMKLSGLIGGGADILLQKHMQKRDEKRGMTDADFEKQMSTATQESYETAQSAGGSVETGILEGVEKKMQIFDEMIAHQKSKQKVRMATAVATGLVIGGGMFSAEDAAAASNIGSFKFGGGGTGTFDASSQPTAENIATEAVETVERTARPKSVDWSDDDWDIPEGQNMAAGLKRNAGIIPGEDGKVMETDIRSEAFGGKAQKAAVEDQSLEQKQRPKVTEFEEFVAAPNEQAVAQESVASESDTVDQELYSVVQESGNVEETASAGDPKLGIFDQLTKSEAFVLKNTDAGSVMRLVNNPQFATDPAHQVLQRIQTRIQTEVGIGTVKIGEESMESYLGRYNGPVSFGEKNAILKFVSRHNNIG